MTPTRQQSSTPFLSNHRREGLLLRVLFLLLMPWFFSCFNKKDRPDNIEKWITRHFPDQLTVVQSNRNLDIVDWLKSGKKIAVVADKNDPELQFTIDWIKSDTLQIDPASVQAALDNHRKEMKLAREMYRQLQEAGLKQHAVGALEQSAYVQVFAEPDPATRLAVIQNVLAALEQRTDSFPEQLWIEFMEPNAYGTEYQTVIPPAHWSRPGTWQESNLLVSVNFNRKKGLRANDLNTGWEWNVHAGRCSVYTDEAYPIAQKWAEKNLKKPFHLDRNRMVSVGLDKAPMSLQIGFPIYVSPPQDNDGQEPTGYVGGTYHIDQKTFDKIHRRDSF